MIALRMVARLQLAVALLNLRQLSWALRSSSVDTGEYHVTRLHRWDHSGLESMLEAEAKWHRNAQIASGRSENLRGAQASPRLVESDGGASLAQLASEARFVPMSRRQVQALRDHHLDHRQQEASFVQLEEPGHEDVSVDTYGPKVALVQKVKVNAHTHHRANLDFYPTALSSLGSQYVGPVGVGTSLSPSGCLPGWQAHDVLASDKDSSLVEGKTCQVKNQADIWVVYDTGSTNIWIASDLCKAGACAKPGRHRYNHEESATYSSPLNGVQLSIQFGTGKIQGPQGVDDFHIGPFTVAKQTFGLIQTEFGNVFDEVPFEGIVGLAWPKMSANGVTPFFDNIIDQGVLNKNQFAFYFHKHDPSANAIFWGGVDPAFHEGEIERFPVVDPYYWSLKLKSFKVGDKTILHSDDIDTDEGADIGSALIEQMSRGEKVEGPFAIVDTGTTYFTVESKHFSEVMGMLPSQDCDTMTDTSHPPITLSMLNSAGQYTDFVLTNDKYMVSSKDGNEKAHCHPGFMKIDIPAKHGPAMVLGEVFLRHYVAVFDRGNGGLQEGTIGFAVSRQEDGAIAHLRRLTGSQPGFQRKDPT